MNLAVSAGQLQPCGFTSAVVYSPSLCLFADCKNISCSTEVESLREKVYGTLEEYCRAAYPDEPGRFAKLLLRLPALRSIGKKRLGAALGWLKIQLPGIQWSLRVHLAIRFSGSLWSSGTYVLCWRLLWRTHVHRFAQLNLHIQYDRLQPVKVLLIDISGRVAA